MKTYLDKKYKEEIKFIVNEILEDEEFWAQGIPRIDSYLQTSHKWFLTEKQASEIINRLRSLVNKMCMRLEKKENS